MVIFEELENLAKKYVNLVDFILIYVEEAHATDLWKIDGNRYQVQTHRTIEDRKNAAKLLKDAWKHTILVDNLNNEAAKMFGALPQRLCLIENGVVEYLGPRIPMNFDINDIDRLLEKFQQKDK